MISIMKISTLHDDIVHDVRYDYYGKRIATFSSDQTIKIWDLDKDGKEFKNTSEWKAHIGSIWRIDWAHPEFGQVIVSCSFDRTVIIWEEEDTKQLNNKSTWHLKASLVDARDSVQDVKFGPKHHGLRLATCSLDGVVRIYEAADPMNLSHWSTTDEIEIGKGKCTCISWNLSMFDAPMLVIGTSDGAIKIWAQKENSRKWNQLIESTSHTDSIHDVCWAANLGRTYHLIASASKDQSVRIWKLSQTDANKSKLEFEQIALFAEHNAEVWRVEWNITGTILASSGDDGNVKLWARNGQGKWLCISGIDESES